MEFTMSSTEGLTAEDMVNSISAKYGPATNVALEIDSSKNDRSDVRQKPVASWEDSQYSFNLVSSSFTDGLGFTIYSKRSEEHTSELQSRLHLVCRLLLEKKKNI